MGSEPLYAKWPLLPLSQHVFTLTNAYATKKAQQASLKALQDAIAEDKDKTTQRSELQPDQYTSALNMNTPLHVSVTWNSITELFVALAEAATNPSTAFPKSEEEAPDRTSLYLALSATACAAVAAVMIWRRSANSV